MSAVSYEHAESGNSLYAALARTGTRTIALYFSRPIRLFRPPKVSGWHSLRGLAAQHGKSLSTEYMQWLVKKQGWVVIPKHFIPPIVINAALGTVLWETYTITSSILEPHLSSHPTTIAALSGASAGGMQALIAAPAENVRLVVEGGSAKGWAGAWKEVFRGTVPVSTSTTPRETARQVRDWMSEVRGMAGRGWDGWGWGCAKDVCGFAAFFSIFEITRRVANRTKGASQSLVDSLNSEETQMQLLRRHFPRTVHGVTLVSGGVIAGLSYEIISRPFDMARRFVLEDRLLPTQKQRSVAMTVINRIKQDGILTFLKRYSSGNTASSAAASSGSGSVGNRWLYGTLRTLARVGPWGVGFLVWEAFGPGLS